MMARYDRIATLPVPSGEDLFTGWLALRDLEGRERDAELGRRLRLHFLVLRPLGRLAELGDAVTAASLEGQLSRTREDLGALPVRDPQRVGLGELLESLRDRAPDSLVRSALIMAERAQRWEHLAAAETYTRCALAIADRSELGRHRIAALRRLSRIAAAAGQLEAAAAYAGRGTALALQLGSPEDWALTVVDRSDAEALRSGPTAALEVLAEVETRAREWQSPAAATLGLVAVCRHMLAHGDADAALQHGWQGLQDAPRSELRLLLLGQIAATLEALGLYDEADHCHALLEAKAGSVQDRLTIRATRARLRAEAGDHAGFRQRAAALVERPGALPAAARLELARGGLLAGELQEARRHAAAALQIARNQLQPVEARAAVELLTTLTAAATQVVGIRQAPRRASRPALALSSAILNLGESLAPSAL
jgi:hypothetical protein